MARLRRSDGTYRRTALTDFGHQACGSCGRFYQLPEPQRDESGFIDPAVKPAPCPHCENAPSGPPAPRCTACNGRGLIHWHPHWDNGHDPCTRCGGSGKETPAPHQSN